MNGKIALLIPCYNEENCVEKMISAIVQELPEAFLVIVNDGSSDNTAKIVRESAQLNDHIILLDLPVNLGIGGAVQTAFRYAARNDFDYAVKVDGDGQHPADQIKKLIEALDANNADMVIGSRFLKKEGFFHDHRHHLRIQPLSSGAPEANHPFKGRRPPGGMPHERQFCPAGRPGTFR